LPLFFRPRSSEIVASVALAALAAGPALADSGAPGTTFPEQPGMTREEWDLKFADVFEQINAFAADAPINVVNSPCPTPSRT
jgi:hypothetical protein